jgi:Cu+-exporting ATPase
VHSTAVYCGVDIPAKYDPSEAASMATKEGCAMGIFQLVGMDCANCASIVSKTLYGIKGVKNIRINYITQKVYVDYDPELTDVSTIRAAIKKAGYRVMRHESVSR